MGAVWWVMRANSFPTRPLTSLDGVIGNPGLKNQRRVNEIIISTGIHKSLLGFLRLEQRGWDVEEIGKLPRYDSPAPIDSLVSPLFWLQGTVRQKVTGSATIDAQFFLDPTLTFSRG